MLSTDGSYYPACADWPQRLNAGDLVLAAVILRYKLQKKRPATLTELVQETHQSKRMVRRRLQRLAAFPNGVRRTSNKYGYTFDAAVALGKHFQIPCELLKYVQLQRLSYQDVVTFSWLLYKSNGTKGPLPWCWAQAWKLAEECGCSRETIRISLANLERQKLLKKVSADRVDWTKNRYFLNVKTAV